MGRAYAVMRPRSLSSRQAVELHGGERGGGPYTRGWMVVGTFHPCSVLHRWPGIKHKSLPKPVQLQRARWVSEARYPLVSCGHGLLHAMMSSLDAANGYQWATHTQGGSTWAQGNMGITTANASMPAAAMILMVAAMAAIFAQLPASTIGQDCGPIKLRAHLGLRKSRAKLPRASRSLEALSIARRRG